MFKTAAITLSLLFLLICVVMLANRKFSIELECTGPKDKYTCKNKDLQCAGNETAMMCVRAQ